MEVGRHLAATCACCVCCVRSSRQQWCRAAVGNSHGTLVVRCSVKPPSLHAAVSGRPVQLQAVLPTWLTQLRGPQAQPHLHTCLPRTHAHVWRLLLSSAGARAKTVACVTKLASIVLLATTTPDHASLNCAGTLAWYKHTLGGHALTRLGGV
jgi:hypothetical protein